MKKFKIIIGETYSSNIEEDRKFLIYDKDLMRLEHQIVTGSSGTGKSYSNIFNIGSSVFNSSYYNENSSFIILDTHNGLKDGVIEVFNNFDTIYKEENQKIGYTKESNLDIKNYTKNVKNNYDRELIFNPLLVKSLQDIDLKDFNKKLFLNIEVVLASLKGFFNKEDFGSRNQNILKVVILFLILINHFRYKKYLELKKEQEGNWLNFDKEDLINNFSQMLTLSHIPEFLEELLQGRDFETKYNEGLRDILNDINLKKYGEKMLKWKEYIIKVLRSNTEFIESSINKLSFLESLKKEFGYEISCEKYSFDLSSNFIDKKDVTNLIIFSLGDYNIIQKKIFSSFLYTYSYYFGLEKDHEDENINTHYIYGEEFNSLVNSNVLLELIGSCTSELRKKKVFYIFFFQDLVTQKGVNEIYENIGTILSFGVTHKQSEFLLEDIKSGLDGDTKNYIDNNDLINLDIGECFLLLKFKEGGNITIKLKSINYKDKNIYKEIFNKLNHEKKY